MRPKGQLSNKFKVHCPLLRKHSVLTLLRPAILTVLEGILGVYSENQTKHVTRHCRRKVEFLFHYHGRWYLSWPQELKTLNSRIWKFGKLIINFYITVKVQCGSWYFIFIRHQTEVKNVRFVTSNKISSLFWFHTTTVTYMRHKACTLVFPCITHKYF